MDYPMSTPYPGLSSQQTSAFPMRAVPPYAFAAPPMMGYPMAHMQPAPQSQQHPAPTMFDASDFPELRSQLGMPHMAPPPQQPQPQPNFSITDESEFPALGMGGFPGRQLMMGHPMPMAMGQSSILGMLSQSHPQQQQQQPPQQSVPMQSTSQPSSSSSSSVASASSSSLSSLSQQPQSSQNSLSVGSQQSLSSQSQLSSNSSVSLQPQPSASSQIGFDSTAPLSSAIGVGVAPGSAPGSSSSMMTGSSAVANAPSSVVGAVGAPSASSSVASRINPADDMHVYGLLGLLDVISMTKQDLTTVTLGLDLTQLGLNLGSQEPLHKTFSSPWLEGPPNNKNFKIPQCYRMQPPALRPQNFQKFSLETLFFIFYAVPRDLLQAAAAQELYNRKWRYHKQLKQWISRAPRTDPTVKTAAFEKGTYICFDPSRWEKLRKENFLLMYEQLEELRFAKPQGQAQAGSAQQQQQHQALHQALAASQQVPHQPQP